MWRDILSVTSFGTNTDTVLFDSTNRKSLEKKRKIKNTLSMSSPFKQNILSCIDPVDREKNG